MSHAPQARLRRSRGDISRIETAIIETLERDHPQTLRGLFYRLVSQGIVPKTDAAYKTTVGRLCVRLRRAGALPYAWLADSTRWQRKPQTHAGLAAALQRTAETYRRAVWADLPEYVEVWLEKDALAGVLLRETAAWDVPLMVTRGYPSLSYLYEAAETITEIGKPTTLYYFGDHDPSGVDIPAKVKRELVAFAPTVPITFVRVAVTAAQIRTLDLPTRPTKVTDTRARHFRGGSVEVDAIPAEHLRALVREVIHQHIPAGHLHTLQVAEASERELLTAIAGRYRGAA
jgi:hypothetical protein